jgi:hypothetical protein
MTIRLSCAVFCGIWLSAAAANGQAALSTDSVGARTHFNEGLASVSRGELEVALREFETAYALKPHYSVLYNIGQAQAALGRSVDAVRTFQRYLVEGGKRLSQARRDEVRDLIATNQAKLGQLRLLGATVSTRVWLDGVELDHTRLGDPLLLGTGKHAVLSSNGSGFPASQEVQLTPGVIEELTLPSPPPPAAAEPTLAPGPAQLRVVCDLPGVEVDVGGTTRATTPLQKPLAVQSGPLTVRFTRAGYLPVTRQLVASPKDEAVVLCDQVLEPVLAPAVKATLVVQTVPFDAEVFVDGKRFLGAALPYGPHYLRVERPGFVSETKTIALRPRDVTTYQVALAPTAARQAAQTRAESRRKLLGYATGGGGVAFTIASAALFGWNGARYDAWRNDTSAGKGDRIASIQRVDDVSVGCATLGVGLIATSAWLLFTKPSGDQ